MLMIGPAEKAALDDLRLRALADVLDTKQVQQQCQTPEGFQAHLARMSALTISLPEHLTLALSFETQICGLCRHMSVSVDVGETPTVAPLAVVIELALALGFTGTLQDWMAWVEPLYDAGSAVNVLQVVQVTEPAMA